MLVDQVEITSRRFIHVKHENQKMTAIIPDPKLGYYKSLLLLKEKGYGGPEHYIELSLVLLNPQLFKEIE